MVTWSPSLQMALMALFSDGFSPRVSGVALLFVASMISVQPLSGRMSSRIRSLLHAVHAITANSNRILLPNLLTAIKVSVTFGIGIVLQLHLDFVLLECALAKGNV